MDSHYVKYRARQALTVALKTGRIEKQPCMVCGSLRSEGHHSDYSKPLEVTWLCRAHHQEEHRRNKEIPVPEFSEIESAKIKRLKYKVLNVIVSDEIWNLAERLAEHHFEGNISLLVREAIRSYGIGSAKRAS